MNRGSDWSLDRRGVLLALASLSLSACGVVELVADNIAETSRFEVSGREVFLSGEININTRRQFDAIHAANPQVDTLVLVDIPGSLDEAGLLSIGYRVRALGLTTHLIARSEVYSGGVDLFLAGVRRRMDNGATLGVHSWSNGTRDAASFPRSAPEHDRNRQYIADMLGDDAFYWFTIYAAPSDGVHIMTPREIRRYGLLTG